MNGNGATVEERMERKRALEQELELIRNQKAEVLRAIQQIAKKQKTGQPLRTTHMTHEAKIDTERRYHAEQMKRIWGNCSAIMKELLKNTSTKLYFGEPVHRDKFPGYYEVIKEPRDLGTIQAQLNRKEYKDIYAFLADVRLCFENCRLFNPLGHPVRKMGDTASDNFEKKWLTKNVEADWEQEIRRHNLTIAKLEAEAKSLPEKVAEVNNELQELAAKVAARESLPAPGPGREMTFEEKRKLSHDLTEIPGERLARVLEIISEDPSAPEGDDGDDDGLELELECLLPETLWKVYAYVETVQAEIRNKAPPSATAMAAAEAAAAAAATGDGATAGGAAAAAPAAPNAAGSDDDEGVGSKGNADSTGAADPSKRAPRGQDLTTFVSATGPGAGQPQILRNAAQKKDVQLQNAGAWANLSQPQEGDLAVGGGTGGTAPDANGENPGAAAGEDAVPMEDDTLWTEFQGREAQQRQAEEQKRKLEEEERRKQEAAEAEAKRLAEEAAQAEAAEQRRKEEEVEAQRKREQEMVEREAVEMRNLTDRGAEEAEAEMLRQVGHESQANLEELGLTARDDEEMEDDEEVI